MKKFINKRFVKEWIEPLLEAVAIAIVLYFLFWPTLLKGNSMQPSLETGDVLVFSRVLASANAISNSDVIICKIDYYNDEEVAIKRVIGIPGDEIKIKDGKVYLNGKLLKEDYLNGQMTEGEDYIKLQEDEYYILGDNRANSYDSRSVGVIDKSQIMGKIMLRLYPISKIRMF